ncbi:MAG: DUF4249 domain-containing protein [Alistipes sp.]|jgi:hypothetical protein|nr:DUF4249 domain-containing protein [Alistipes sp.]
MRSRLQILFTLLSILPLSALFEACEPAERPWVYDEKIVVEGSIEAGRGAVVWLSKSLYVPYGEFSVEDISRIPIRLAKVTVSGGGRTEVLVSRVDRDHLLGWCYRGSEVVGVVGEEYTLTVEYSGFVLTATTTIPAPARLGEVSVGSGAGGGSEGSGSGGDSSGSGGSGEAGGSGGSGEAGGSGSSGSGSGGSGDGSVSGSPEVSVVLEGLSPGGYYMLMARPRDEGTYNPCLFGILDGASVGAGARSASGAGEGNGAGLGSRMEGLRAEGSKAEGGSASITVLRPMDITAEGGYVPTWGAGESVQLRLASIDRPAFDYWSAFMNDAVNAHNPVYPSFQNLPSNIRGGGLGVWYGFSASYGEFETPPEEKVSLK